MVSALLSVHFPQSPKVLITHLGAKRLPLPLHVIILLVNTQKLSGFRLHSFAVSKPSRTQDCTLDDPSSNSSSGHENSSTQVPTAQQDL